MGFGLLDWNFDDPRNQGLLAMGLNMMANSGPSTQKRSMGSLLGSSGLAGMQAYQSATLQKQKQDEMQRRMKIEEEENDFMRKYRGAQMEEIGQKSALMKSKQAGMTNLQAKLDADPTYKPTAADLMSIDPEHAFKLLTPGGVDHGLNPQVGMNPSTGKMGYFIQDKAGNTKWLDAGVPPNYQFVPGNGYTPNMLFDKREGTTTPVKAPAANNPAIPASAPVIDQTAPWARLANPKDVADMQKRTWELDNKRLDDLRAEVQKGRGVMRDLERFGELNRKQETGGVIDRISWMPTFDDEKREMESIQKRLAPYQRPEGSGSSSNFDVTMYLEGLPGIDKDGPVNKNIRDAYARQLQDREQMLTFKEKYLMEKGHLAGSDEAYKAHQKQQNIAADPKALQVKADLAAGKINLQQAKSRLQMLGYKD